jgi:beta-lactamase superfamily II metal-dependent hydrolase
MRCLLLTLSLFISTALLAKDKPLEIYFVDVEGGQATLFVAPSGESLLIDTGWPGFGGRDADRIVAAAREAGLKRIDFVLITHYHEDHVGGVPQLAERIPIGAFIDHGPNVERSVEVDALVAAYDRVVTKARHLVVKPGDKIPIRGIEVEIVTAGGQVVLAPLAGAGQANPHCTEWKPQDKDNDENARSVGTLIRYGKFRMIDLGDLTHDREFELACPVNRIGRVSVYLSTAHAHPGFGQAALIHALTPRVAIMNNGSRKGGDAAAWQIVRASPRLEGIWQIHDALEAGKQNNAPEEFIANPEEKCAGRSIQISAGRDGSFAVKNTRNGFSKRYNPH